MEKQRTYVCIDMKSFYASVECAERHLSPFETNLVVADETRGKGAITLAISPKMKSLGVKNRCRLFEIPQNMDYIIAMPRMSLYIKYCADIFEIYLDYFSQDDIHQYSIDEAFIDVTDYLPIYHLSAKDLAKKLINEIAVRTHIPATCGIGSNLYLAKLALDITAKHCKDHIGELTVETFKETLWHHRPITDFWSIANGIATRLARYGIYDMKGIADAPEDLMYRLFGKNAKIIIDHANGKESCMITDIKSYKSKSKSISNSQILFSDYDYDKALLVLQEMALNGCQRLLREHLIASHVGIMVGYSKDVIPATGGTIKMANATNLALPCQPFQFVTIAAVVVITFDNQMPVSVYHLYIVKVLNHGLKISVTSDECSTVEIAVPSSASSRHKVITCFETVFESVFQISPRFLVLKVNFFVDCFVGDIFFASPTVFVCVDFKEKISCFVELFVIFRIVVKHDFFCLFHLVLLKKVLR